MLCTMCMHGTNTKDMWTCAECGARHCRHIHECDECDSHRNEKKRETNVEFVTRLMEMNPYAQGGLTQAFIISAMEYYATRIASGEFRIPENGLIHPDAWKRCAEQVLQQLQVRE